MIHEQSIVLFLSDLRVALAAEDMQAMRSRISLFEMMHLSSDEEAREEMPGRKRLVLRVETDEIIICDEYYPEDNGRVHMIPVHRYATFHRDDMTIEFQKVTMDIVEIIYEGDEWPSDLTETSHPAIVAYYTGQRQ